MSDKSLNQLYMHDSLGKHAVCGLLFKVVSPHVYYRLHFSTE